MIKWIKERLAYVTRMNFENKSLERMARSLKWVRNNSLQIFDIVQGQGIANYRPDGDGQHTILYQFQCLVTTTDAYYRRLIGHNDKRFGVLVVKEVTQKSEIAEGDIKNILKRQIIELENVLKSFSADDFEANIQDIQSIINHEYLHQGQLVVMLRSCSVVLPERFRTAFDL